MNALGALERNGVRREAIDTTLIVRRAKAYDRAAFEELYHFAVVPVYRYLSARLDTVAEAEDLTQEVFLAALAGIEGLRAEDESGVLAWLFQIARHKLADCLRRRYRRPTAPLEEADRIEAEQPQPDEVAESDEERAELRRALDQLTTEQREVVVFKYVLGYSNEQTARVMGKNVNAINQLHHRSLASLQRLLTSKVGRGFGQQK